MKCLLCHGRGCDYCFKSGRHLTDDERTYRSTIVTCLKGINADMIENVARLYLRPGMSVADVTYANGNFWKKIDTRKYYFFPSDIKTGIDFRELPYADNSMHVIVLDPPYQHNTNGSALSNGTYNLKEVSGMSRYDILMLYTAGMREAFRCLKPGGTLWVKCQDTIYKDTQEWVHDDILAVSRKLGYYAKDLFILHTNPMPVNYVQQHARKNHSYLWIFQKVEEKQ